METMLKSSGVEPTLTNMLAVSSTSIKSQSTYLRIYQDNLRQTTVFHPVQALQICHRFVIKMKNYLMNCLITKIKIIGGERQQLESNQLDIFVFVDQCFLTGVNITNVLLEAFSIVDPKRVKNTVKSKVSFYK